jgi:hypothetical protein
MSCEDRREGRESEPGGAGGREDGGGALYRDQTAQGFAIGWSID